MVIAAARDEMEGLRHGEDGLLAEAG
jgi:hypothetical protein